MIPDPAGTRPAEESAFKRRGHIVLTLLVVLLLVGFVPLAFLSSQMIRTNREALSTAEQKYQLLLASSVGQELDVRVSGLQTQVERVATTLGAAVRRHGSIPREEIRSALAEVTDGQLGYLRYTYVESGRVRSVSAGDHPDYLEPMFAASLQQAAAAHGESSESKSGSMLSDPFLLKGDGERTAFVIAAPVASGGSFRGVLTALVDLTQVWDSVVGSVRTGHVLFAMDEEGNVFSSSDRVRVKPGRDLRDSELVQRFLSFEGRARAAMPFVRSKHGEERRFIGAFEETALGWGIFVQAREMDVYWTVSNMERRALTLTLVLLGLAGLAAVFLARGLSNPVNRLAAAARELAAGNFSVRVRLRQKNEIGELGHTFNQMAGKIEDTIRKLDTAFKENNALFLGTIRALAQAIDAKDPYTQGHSVRVNRYSVILAREMGLSDVEVRDIHVASLLHDVGKIGIDDGILRKTESLTDEEFAIIKQHPVLGANIMAPIAQMKNMIPGLRYHHERSNGTGYPDGLRDEQIPLMAKIIAVADTFDAITTNRPYQHKMTLDQAVARINELKGPALDPRVVEAFNRVVNAGLIRLDAQCDRTTLDVPDLPVESAAPVPVSAQGRNLTGGSS